MKIVSCNIQWGLGVDGRVDLARMVRDARDFADFDVLCLQEVTDNFDELKANPGDNEFAAIAALLPGYVAVEGVALDVPDQQGGRRRFGNMVLSRLPIGQVLRYTLPWESDKTLNMPRALLDVVIEAPFGPLRAMTTHLEYSSDKLRRAQVEGIRSAHRAACERVRQPRRPGVGTYRILPGSCSAVLMGDFNMRPSDPVKHRISDPIETRIPRLVDAWQALNGAEEHPISFYLFDRSEGEPHCCDFAFVSEDLVPRLSDIAYNQKSQASDHQPVVVVLDD
jgi:endonuclease/exonuclease/phosphatase family metal-dependent hydrolase